MAINDINEYRQKLKEKVEGTKKNFKSSGDGASYPFWNIKDDQEARIRFIQDKNPENPWIYVQRQIIKLPFNGIEGEHNNPVTVNVPCIKAWDSRAVCPIKSVVDPWWKTPKEDLARTYKIHRSYIYQGFVVSSPLVEEEIPENPIRKFVINPQIFKIIAAAEADDSSEEKMESVHWDVQNGYDFRVRKTNNGKWSSYHSSKFSIKPRALTESEMAAIVQYEGGFNLIDSLGTKPDSATLDLISRMFEASLNGDAYDKALFGDTFRPYGFGGSKSTESVPEADAVSSETTVSNGTSTPTPQDILAKIRNRNNA